MWTSEEENVTVVSRILHSEEPQFMFFTGDDEV